MDDDLLGEGVSETFIIVEALGDNIVDGGSEVDIVAVLEIVLDIETDGEVVTEGLT